MTAADAPRRRGAADRLFWALLATVAWAPLPLGSNRLWAWSLLGLAIAALVLAWAAAALRDPELAQLEWSRYRAAALAAVLLVLWFLVQQSALTPASWRDPLWGEAGALIGRKLRGALAIDPAAARETLLRLLSYAGVFFLAFQLGRDRDRARLALWSLALAGAAYAAYGLAVYLNGNDVIIWYAKWAYRDALTSTFVNKNSYGAYAGLTLIAALALFRMTAEEALRHGLFNRFGLVHFIDNAPLGLYVLLVAIVVIATALLFAQSRGAFLATGLGVLVFLAALRLSRGQGREAERQRLPRFALALAIGAILLTSFSGGALLSRFADYAGSSSGRGSIYAITLEAIRDHPWLGTGLGSFHDIFPLYRDSRLDDGFATYDLAHNTYLELALEIGLPALAVLLGILVAIALACARGLVLRRRDGVYPAAALGITALLALHSMVDFSLQMPAIAVAYALVIGVGFAQSFPTRGRTGNGR
jgi:O-antigen ligase